MHISSRNGFFLLLSFVVLVPAGRLLAEPVRSIDGELPPVLDLCKHQTAVRNQGARDVCPYFPPVAALEAAYHRMGVKVDLSVEHLIWLRNVTAGGGHATPERAENLVSTLGGGGAEGSLNVLSHYAICRAEDLPYRGDNAVARVGNSDYYKGFALEKYDWSKPQSQFVLNRWNLDPRQLPPAARANAQYGIDKFVMLAAKERKDPKKFEEILASGREIVTSLLLNEDVRRVDKGQPVWRYKPGGKAMNVRHLVLVVGYDRERKFFIVKNSWGPINYSKNKDQLDPQWKDIVKYDSYTLVDYNYLAVCMEAGYVTEVAPVGSPRFTAQRALGQWQVTLKQKDETIMTGVLCWRRLPYTDKGAKQKDLRIGDLVTKDGQQFRVNAKLDGDGIKPYQVTLYIDFAKGTMPVTAADGTAWSGTLVLPKKGQVSMQLSPHGGAKQTLWGQPAAQVLISAARVDDQNLLKAVEPPK
jgi:Papain family cysteine protease